MLRGSADTVPSSSCLFLGVGNDFILSLIHDEYHTGCENWHTNPEKTHEHALAAVAADNDGIY